MKFLKFFPERLFYGELRHFLTEDEAPQQEIRGENREV